MTLNKNGYRKAVVTFIDILGFTALVEKCPYREIVEILHFFQRAATSDPSEYGRKLSDLSSGKVKQVFNKTPIDGSSLYRIDEKRIGKPTQRTPLHVLSASDSIIRFCFEDECLEDYTFAKCIDDEILNLQSIQSDLCRKGVLIRGGVTIGEFAYIPTETRNNMTFFGKAYNRAFYLESQLAIYPRIILDPKINWHDETAGATFILDKYYRSDFDSIAYIDYLDENRISDCLESCKQKWDDSLPLVVSESTGLKFFIDEMAVYMLKNGKLPYNEKVFAKHGWLFNHLNSAILQIKQAADLISCSNLDVLPTEININDFFEEKSSK
jgi:hypothetical protein